MYGFRAVDGSGRGHTPRKGQSRRTVGPSRPRHRHGNPRHRCMHNQITRPSSFSMQHSVPCFADSSCHFGWLHRHRHLLHLPSCVAGFAVARRLPGIQVRVSDQVCCACLLHADGPEWGYSSVYYWVPPKLAASLQADVWLLCYRRARARNLLVRSFGRYLVKHASNMRRG